jgi:hypothetical protein
LLNVALGCKYGGAKGNANAWAAMQ